MNKRPYAAPEDFQKYCADLPRTKTALEKNGFEVFIATDKTEARTILLDLIARERPLNISWGGSLTLEEAGIIDALKKQNEIPVIITTGSELPAKQKQENRRLALTCGFFVSSANAITAQGQLVNLDGIGNRVAAMAFGPHTVVVVAGRNKVAASLASAMDRVKNHAAPMNVRRFSEMDIPCVENGHCYDCNSQSRICNVWSITEKSRPKGRIKIILVEENLGY